MFVLFGVLDIMGIGVIAGEALDGVSLQNTYSLFTTYSAARIWLFIDKTASDN